MRIFHFEALADPHYMENCYDANLQAFNSGWLTLVSPKYFEFGKALLNVAGNALTQKRIEELGNKVIEVGKGEVDGNVELRRDFLDISADFELELAEKEKI
jgi:hypothetical protein